LTVKQAGHWPGILPVAKSITPLWEFEWRLPGHGESYVDCGSKRYKGCLNVEEHNQEGLFDSRAGKIFVRLYRRTCLRADCPTCYEKWAGKGAGKIEYRLMMAPGSGRPIHVVASPPVSDVCSLSFQDLRKKSYVVMKKSGFYGGSCIFHPFREDELTGKWYFSPHFHFIGFGWIKKTKEGFNRHGWIVHNIGVRETVSGTALYQLSHAGVHDRHHTVTWMGSLSYNRFKIPPKLPERDVCPLCGQELRELVYLGSEDLPDVEEGFWLEPNDEWWVYAPPPISRPPPRPSFAGKWWMAPDVKNAYCSDPIIGRGRAPSDG
jgi:hypothetical protein